MISPTSILTVHEIANSLNAIQQNFIHLEIFIPSKDKENVSIDHTFWVDYIALSLAESFNGCTIFPESIGLWMQSNTLIKEVTTIISCYTSIEKLSESLARFKTLLYDFALETNQDNLLIVINGKSYFISF